MNDDTSHRFPLRLTNKEKEVVDEPYKKSTYFHLLPLFDSHMGVVQNSFFSKRPFLAKKKFTLAKLSPFPQKTFAGPYVGLYLGIFVRKQKLDKGNLPV